MQKHEDWLGEQLPQWEREGLIDAATAERLRGRFEPENRVGGNLAMIIISSLGALLVGLGVIALFAANWETLSRAVRAGISLLPLTICSALALIGFARNWQARPFWEALGVLWTIAIWSGFALVCQTYQLSDDVRGFVLACSLLGLPVLYLTQSAAATVVWPIYGLIWFLTGQEKFNIWDAAVYFAMLAAHLPILVMIHRRIKFRKLYEFFGSHIFSAGVVSIIVALGEHWWHSDFNGFLLTTLLAGSALLVLSEHSQWRAMRAVGLLALLPFVFVAPVGNWDNHTSCCLLEMVFFGALTLPVLADGIYLIRRQGENRLSPEMRHQLIVVLAGLVAGMAILLSRIDFLLYLWVVVIASLALIQALRHLFFWQMNIALLALIYEILAKFFESSCSFVVKGITLLVCGAALLSSNIFIIRRRKKLAAKEVAR